MIVYKILNNLAPEYFNSFAQPVTRNRENLRSASDQLLLQLSKSNKTLRYHLINNWNSLPYELRSIPTVEQFKTSLKIFYFRLAYD